MFLRSPRVHIIGAYKRLLIRAVQTLKGTPKILTILFVALCRALSIHTRLVLQLPPSEITSVATGGIVPFVKHQPPANWKPLLLIPNQNGIEATLSKDSYAACIDSVDNLLLCWPVEATLSCEVFSRSLMRWISVNVFAGNYDMVIQSDGSMKSYATLTDLGSTSVMPSISYTESDTNNVPNAVRTDDGKISSALLLDLEESESSDAEEKHNNSPSNHTYELVLSNNDVVERQLGRRGLSKRIKTNDGIELLVDNDGIITHCKPFEQFAYEQEEEREILADELSDAFSDRGRTARKSPVVPASIGFFSYRGTDCVMSDSYDHNTFDDVSNSTSPDSLCSRFSHSSPTSRRGEKSTSKGVRSFILAANAFGLLRDVTKRYNVRWSEVLRERTKDIHNFWETSLNRLQPPKYQIPTTIISVDGLDEFALQEFADKENLPRTKQAFKGHPKFALESLIKKNEIITPLWPILGYFEGQKVYSRGNVWILRTRGQWDRENRNVLQHEVPLRTSTYTPISMRQRRGKTTPCDSTASSNSWLASRDYFAEWQTELLPPRTVAGGLIPVDAYGHVDLIGKKIPPDGTIHISGKPGVEYVAKRLGIQNYMAVVGFDYTGGKVTPKFDGVVVLQEDAEKILKEYTKYEKAMAKRALNKLREKACQMWSVLFKALLFKRVVSMLETHKDDDKKRASSNFNWEEI